MQNRPTIVLVLRSGKDFAFRDVELIARHINGKWRSDYRPRIICLWDKATTHYDLGNIEFLPLTNNYPGTWSRIQLYSPDMEQYRPFLYLDLDTAVVGSLESIFALVRDPDKFITLEDFWQHKQLATGLMWIPAKSEKISKIWNEFKGNIGNRMDKYIRSVTTADKYWQQLTHSIYDFKPREGSVLTEVPPDANLICFHGKPRIFQVGTASMSLNWVTNYINTVFKPVSTSKKVTVIIPYKKDRGWLKEAVASIPSGVQIIQSQGDGNWPQNFNKAFPEATGDYIRYLHEDDMLTENCIDDSIGVIEDQQADFIHGNAIEFYDGTPKKHLYKPAEQYPTLESLLKKNVIHSASVMYTRNVFEKVGLFNEDNKMHSFEEYEFHLRCLKAGMKIGYVDAPLAYYRRHTNQIIRTVSKMERKENRQELLKSFMK